MSMTGGVEGFDLGMLWDPNTTEPPPNSMGSELAQIQDWWPFFCHDQGFHTKHSDGERYWVPKLTGWRRMSELEVFEFELRARLGEVEQRMIPALMSARRAHDVSVENVGDDPGHLACILNHAKVPRTVPFNPKHLHPDPNVLYIGKSAMGPRVYWDPTVSPHFAFIGLTGSGKTELACMILAQMHMRGGTLVLATPTELDANLSMFAELGHEAICGEGAEALTRMHAAFLRVDDEMSRREKDMGSRGLAVYDGGYMMIVIDEPAFVLGAQPGDTPEMTEQRQTIHKIIKKLAKRGRKVKCGMGLMTQEPYAEDFGGDLSILKQCGLRLGIKLLSGDGIGALFGKLDDEDKRTVAGVLSTKASSPAGRAIGFGLVQPEGEWEHFPVNFAPLQIAHWELPDRREYCGLTRDLPNRPATPGPAPEPDDAMPVMVEILDDDGTVHHWNAETGELIPDEMLDTIHEAETANVGRPITTQPDRNPDPFPEPNPDLSDPVDLDGDGIDDRPMPGPEVDDDKAPPPGHVWDDRGEPIPADVAEAQVRAYQEALASSKLAERMEALAEAEAVASDQPMPARWKRPDLDTLPAHAVMLGFILVAAVFGLWWAPRTDAPAVFVPILWAILLAWAGLTLGTAHRFLNLNRTFMIVCMAGGGVVSALATALFLGLSGVGS